MTRIPAFIVMLQVSLAAQAAAQADDRDAVLVQQILRRDRGNGDRFARRWSARRASQARLPAS